MHVVNGVAKIWSREARWTYAAALLLADAYPNRHVLGLGFGDARPGIKPMAAMIEYLDALDALELPNPSPAAPIRRILATYGPKMLELARDRAAGAHSYHVTVAHTAQAREILGPDAFLGVEQAVLFESDPVEARAMAREHLAVYLTQKFNIAKFHRMGYSEEELAGGGSDRFVDDLVFWGDLDTIVEKLQRHVHAGADHVGIQVLVDPGRSAMPHWRALGEALLPQGVNAR
jgi:probable F420-dependent oxidoreductase